MQRRLTFLFVIKYLTNATTINLFYCNKITDEGLKYLTNATTINLSYRNKITDEGIRKLRERNLNIIILNVNTDIMHRI